MKNITLPDNSKMLSPNFVYGVATASFQIEGGADQRLPCIWDTFCATAGKIADNSNGDIACDHYNNWYQDIELIDSLGVDAYRLSISWPRILTRTGELNPEGVNFYLNILNELQARNIKAYVTLYHWDLPQYLEELGGWLNRDTAYKYAEYVDKVTQIFAGRVFSYATFNEPFCSAYLGYEIGVHAPGLKGKEYGRKAAHHILLAHGLAMQALQKNSPDSKNGIVLNFTPCYPQTDSPADIQAKEYADQYLNQWYIKPLFDASYPSMIDELPEECKPDIHPGDMDIISQPLDFLGVNYYTRLTYSAPKQSDDFYYEHPHLEPKTDIGWEIYPQALTELLLSLNKKYPLPPIFITENGAAMDDKVSEDGEINDYDRLEYYHNHLNAVNKAIEQGVDIRGYFAWSLMDNFEWAEGYLKRFGIVRVDYPTQKRTIKLSGKAYSSLIKSRK